QGRLWGVENGRDQLRLSSGDIHNTNPAEELNLFDTTSSGKFYGYPYCWSEGIWSGGHGPGTQHLDPDLPGTGHSESWCQNTSNVVPPKFAMPAHYAPLGIVEYRGSAYPSSYAGNLFVTSHGSWNSDTPVGRLILRAQLSGNNVTSVTPFVGEINAGSLA